MLLGPRASPGRLHAWAEALDRNLVGDERVSGSPYNWLAYRISRSDPMLVADAAKIYTAGMRVQQRAFASDAEREAALKSGEYLHSVYEWQLAFGEHLPAVLRYHAGYGVEHRFEGVYDKPLVPVMLPLEYLPVLTEELAEIAVERDDGGRRAKKGEQIEQFFKERIARNTRAIVVPWNFSASYAIEQVALRILFRDYYRGRFGEPSERLYSAVNEAGFAIGREFERILSDPKPGAFGRAMDRLRDEVDKAHEASEDRR